MVVVDSGRPRNAPAQGVHGLLGHDGVPPAELLERGRAEVRRYGGEVVTGEVENVRRDEGRFVVSLTDGRNVSARRILVTTGLVDELPAITGLRERWGRDVLHCPYCHGWEVRDKEIGVLANGPRSVHQALLFRQLSDRVTYFTNGTRLPDDETEQLAARDVRIVAGRIDSLVVADNALCGVQLEDGTVVDAQAFAVMPHMVARGGFLDRLGLHVVPHPSGIGEHVTVDANGRTNVPGVWAAGNVTDIAAKSARPQPPEHSPHSRSTWISSPRKPPTRLPATGTPVRRAHAQRARSGGTQRCRVAARRCRDRREGRPTTRRVRRRR